MEEPGQKLKRVRERLRLKFRDVEEASARIAARHGNDEFLVALSRLADIENKGTMPSVYRLYSLCAIYRLDLNDVLSWFGVSMAELPGDADVIQQARNALPFARFSRGGRRDSSPSSPRSGHRPQPHGIPEPADPAMGQASTDVAE